MSEKYNSNNMLLLGSIDLKDSTLIKSIINETTINSQKEDQYIEYLEKLYWIELLFYSDIQNNYRDLAQTEEITPLNLFTIKNMGDEFWFTIDIKKNDFKMFVNVISSVYWAFRNIREPNLAIYKNKRPQTPLELDENNLPEIKLFDFKGYFDIIDDCIDASAIRSEYFMKNITNMFQTPKGPIKIASHQKTELLNKFNACIAINNKIRNKVIICRRTDLIGYEIDRFSRFTKYAITDYFCIGENLFNKLKAVYKNELNVYNFYYLNFSDYYWSFKNHKPKGIKNYYKIYYMIAKREFNKFKNDVIHHYQNPNELLPKKDFEQLEQAFKILKDICINNNINITE